jgi:hypothetical protein
MGLCVIVLALVSADGIGRAHAAEDGARAQPGNRLRAGIDISSCCHTLTLQRARTHAHLLGNSGINCPHTHETSSALHTRHRNTEEAGSAKSGHAQHVPCVLDAPASAARNLPGPNPVRSNPAAAFQGRGVRRKFRGAHVE